MESPYYLNTPTNRLIKSLTTDILKHHNATGFHQSLPEYAVTPLIHLPVLAQSLGVADIWVKDEAQRFGLQAFKGLGASYAIHSLLQEYPYLDTFCTATDGNHGRAVAWAARKAGKVAVVLVPKHTSLARIAAIEQEGAKVHVVDGDYDQTCVYARQLSSDKGWQLVQDTAWEGYEDIPARIMAGYLTHFRELEQSLHLVPHSLADVVFLQAGVGSWAASAVWYYLNRYGPNRPKLIVVEPTASDGILESFKQGTRSFPKGNLQTIMAGLNCGIPSLSAWGILKSGVDGIMRVDDSFATRAMKLLYHPSGSDPQLIAGESGVGGLAGFLALMTNERYLPLKEYLNLSSHSRILFYNTEGATDPLSFQKIVSG